MQEHYALVISTLRAIVGRKHVLVGHRRTLPFRRAFRGAGGPAVCVVRPGSLVALWKVLKACVAADCVIVMQAANTSLTGGSTPIALDNRRSVVINTRRLNQIRYLEKTNQILAHPGATLFDVEQTLQRVGRSPHSVIGSSCFGASVIGGVCNNSGGALVHRGPAYTELSLFARLKQDGELELVNHLDIALGTTPEEILGRLDSDDFNDSRVNASDRRGSASDYETIVRSIDQDSPARHNADPRRLYEASGSAGKIAVFAVRVDSFPELERQSVTILGSKSPAAFAKWRRDVLTSPSPLPVSAEYLHKETLRLGVNYGRDTIRLIHWLGTSRLPTFFDLKRRVDGICESVGMRAGMLTDRLLQTLGRMTPNPIPKKLRTWLDEYDHLLIVTEAAGGAKPERRVGTQAEKTELGVYRCNVDEAKRMALVRYAAAAAAVRYATLKHDEVEDVIALDIALKRNDPNWFEELPDSISRDLLGAHYYGHFLCHVFHQDYLVRKGVNLENLKRRLLEFINARGGVYPAEHNVGHYYHAPEPLQAHYRELDPLNAFNAGVGKMSTDKRYNERCCRHD
ncbi:MAG: D-lactate dehydrogenase [Pseudomonadota bacterium]